MKIKIKMRWQDFIKLRGKIQHTVWPPPASKEGGTADPKGHAAWHRRPTPFGPRLGRRSGIPERKLKDKVFIWLPSVSRKVCWKTFKFALGKPRNPCGHL